MVRIDIDYSGRPNKSLVRSRIFHIIEETFQPQYEHSEKLSYITFSGYRFIDSIEFYKRFNIRNIYSIENKPWLVARAEFNRPYEFISITKGRVADFIDERYEEVIETNKVIFLDYESRFSDVIISDLEAIFSSGFFNEKGLLFITFNTGFDGGKLTAIARDVIPENIRSRKAFEEWISKSFSHFILDKVQRKYKDKKMVREVLKVFYKDTARMVVLGYLITESSRRGLYLKTIPAKEFALPVLTFLEKNYIQNNLSGDPKKIAGKLGLELDDVREYIKYA